MIIWKNTCGESWQDTIENCWEVSGKPGAFLFFIPKGALTHHLLKQAVVALPLVGHVRSPRGIAAPAGAAGRCHSPAGAAVIVHAAGPVMGWQNAIPHSCRLPAQTCHRQLCRRDGRAPGLGRAHFLFVKRNKNSLYAGGKENEWRSIIWRRRWSAGARGAPLWPLPPI